MNQKAKPLIIGLFVLSGGLLAWGVTLRSTAREMERSLEAKTAELADAQGMIETLKAQVRRSAQNRMAPLAVVEEEQNREPEAAPLIVRAEEPASEEQPGDAREERRRDWGRSMAERIEEMKKNNPEQFAEMQERMENRRVEMEARYQDRINFLSSLDTSTLSPEYRENHEALLARLATTHAAFQEIMEDPFSEENRARGREIWGGMRELNEMMKVEREVLLHDLAAEAGYSGEKASEFVEYIGYVNEMTSLRPPRGGRGPGRGGPGGAGGGAGPEGR